MKGGEVSHMINWFKTFNPKLEKASNFKLPPAPVVEKKKKNTSKDKSKDSNRGKNGDDKSNEAKQGKKMSKKKRKKLKK